MASNFRLEDFEKNRGTNNYVQIFFTFGFADYNSENLFSRYFFCDELKCPLNTMNDKPNILSVVVPNRVIKTASDKYNEQ